MSKKKTNKWIYVQDTGFLDILGPSPSELFLFSFPTAHVPSSKSDSIEREISQVGWFEYTHDHKPGKENVRHSLIVQDIKHGGQSKLQAFSLPTD